ncbi:hypothetical protein GCM10028784_19970 [Myceligenerans cantabricum]
MSTLREGTPRPAAGLPPLHLLDPAARVVPLQGRDGELAGLEEWAADPLPLRVRLLTGRGGVGKTRLAVEVQAALHRRRWRTAFVPRDTGPEAAHRTCHAALRRGRPLLVVLDDAGERDDVLALVESLAAASASRLRVLLTARTGRGWWHRLGWSPLWADGAAADRTGLAAPAPSGIPATVRSAAAAFAGSLGVRTPHVVVPPSAGSVHLDAHAAALATVLAPAPGGLPVDADPATGLAELLDLVRTGWHAAGAGAGLSPGQVDGALAAVMVFGDGTRPVAEREIERALGGPPHPAAATFTTEALATGLPDRLAELHVARTLTGSPGMTAACTTALSPSEAASLATLAARLDHDGPQPPGTDRLALDLYAAAVAAVAHRDAGAPPEPAAVHRIHLSLSGRLEVPLRGVLQDVARVAADLAGPDGREHLAALVDRATGLLSVDHEVATLVAVEAADRARALAADGVPGAPELSARALGVAATARMIAGRADEAVALTARAIPLVDGTGGTGTGWTSEVLGRLLTERALCLSITGEEIAADLAGERALSILRDGVGRDAGEFTELLVRALATRVRQVHRGRPEVAHRDLTEAVALTRVLYRERPGLRAHTLAVCLANLATACRALGAGEAGEASAAEAVELLRPVAAAEPSHGAELAAVQGVHGGLLADRGDLAAALGLLEAGVAGFRAGGTVRDPDEDGRLLADLADVYDRLARPRDAVAVDREAVALWRAAPDGPSGGARRRAALAGTLLAVAGRLLRLSRPDVVAGRAEEALHLYRGLAAVGGREADDGVAAAGRLIDEITRASAPATVPAASPVPEGGLDG